MPLPPPGVRVNISTPRRASARTRNSVRKYDFQVQAATRKLVENVSLHEYLLPFVNYFVSSDNPHFLLHFILFNSESLSFLFSFLKFLRTLCPRPGSHILRVIVRFCVPNFYY